MAFEVGDHVFIDESKSKSYYVAAAAIAPGSRSATDRAIRALTRPGQRRFHFKSESDSSKRSLLSHLALMDVRVAVYVAKGLPDKTARTLCLEAVVSDLAQAGASRLTLERDQSLVAADRRIIRDALVKHDYVTKLNYEHAAPSEHSLLWVSDAVAWCHQAGGDWIRRSRPLVSSVRQVG